MRLSELIASAVTFALITCLVSPEVRAQHPTPSEPEAATTGLHEEEGAHGGGHAEPSLFAGDWGNVVYTLLIFGLVVFILGKFAWNPLLTVLQQREQTIRDSLVQAKEEREAAEKLLVQYRSQLETAKEEAAGILEKSRRDAEEVARRIQEQAREDSERTIERAQKEIELAKDAAVKELYDQTAELAVQVATKILRRELKNEDHEALIAESLERIGSV